MIENLFATPIYSAVVDNFQSLNYHIDKVIHKIKFYRIEGWGSTHLLSTDFSKNDKINILNEFGLNKLSKEIDKHLREYCSEIGYEYKRYKMDSWLSKFEKGHYAHIHHHGVTDISGVYYYKTNGKDGNLFFETPNQFLDSTLCYEKYGDRWVHYPKEGKLVLFPGWLKHGVSTNDTDDDRISLSFNIIFDRR